MNKRMERKAQENPSYLLLNNMSMPPRDPANAKMSQFRSKENPHEVGLIRKRVAGNVKPGSKKVIDNLALWDDSTNAHVPRGKDGEERIDRNSYYKFYLNHAQKAINTMITQHKKQ